MMKELSEPSNVLKRLGFDQNSGKYNVRPVFYTLTVTFLIGNCTLYILVNWDDLKKRMNGIKLLVLHFRFIIHPLAHLVNWDKSIALIRTLDEGVYKSPSKRTRKISNFERSIHHGLLQMNTIWYYGFVSYSAMQILSTLVVFVLQIIRYTTHGEPIKTLFLPNLFYFPTNCDTLPAYILAFFIQVIFYFDGTMFAYSTIVSGFVSLKLIEGELRLLRLTIEDMDSLTERDEATWREDNADVNLQTLREFGLRIITHHKVIYRKARNVINGIPIVAIPFNSCSSLQLCTSIYIIVQNDNLMANIMEGWYCVMITSALYLCNVMGENIYKEDENLRNALYEYSWVDKPIWFKKSLLIMMARTNKSIEITSPGLFTLNQKTFSMKMQAAYSFYNVLNKFKN